MASWHEEHPTASERIRAYRFFREHAGYVVGENARGALELARAEQLLQEAQNLSMAYTNIVADEEGTLEGCPAVGIVVGVFEPGDVTPSHVASLWGIEEDAPDSYLRVVRAELASELHDELRQTIGDTLDEREEA